MPQTPAPRPLCLVLAVGLTPRHLGPHTPRLSALAAAGRAGPLAGVTPAVTLSAQASLLTGLPPQGHGVVGNGWYFRETGEVRFWQQASALLQAEPFHRVAQRRARERGTPLRVARLFWWFNQGSGAELSLTPKPHYGSDGSKALDIHGDPAGFADRAQAALGAFPFPAFWGPLAGEGSSRWIARAAAWTLREEQPGLSMVYLPHLDYDLQRHGPDGPHLAGRLAELDACVGEVLDACAETGTTPVVLSEYGIEAVGQAVLPNRALREAGLLVVRDGPFGEQLESFQSRAFAVCDHQLAHVYVRDAGELDRVHQLVAGLPGVERVLAGEARAEWGLDHPRSGELVAMAAPGHWFAYPFWLDDRHAPDYARTVDIHRKPGYDPCELVFDPALRAPKLRAGLRLLQKKLGLRYRMDVVGLDPSVVRGSHGRPPADPQDGPVWIGPAGDAPARMEDVGRWCLQWLELDG